ncbi:MAG: carboxymuconolactone decarboxylase family protein [Rhodospirillales bacterium]|jgi:alkylhydroperoxidase family enzyme
MSTTTAERIHLIKPNEATGDVAEIFEDIKRTKGERYLTPTWGFFAHDPELLRHWWGLQKKLQKTAGTLPKKLMFGIYFILAAEVGCPRCINNAQTHLIDAYDMSAEEVDAYFDFENADSIPDNEKAVLRFTKKVGFGLETTEEDFADLRKHGYGDKEIVEMVSLVILEAGFIRRAFTVAKFEDGDQWPRENMPSKFYGQNVGGPTGQAAE